MNRSIAPLLVCFSLLNLTACSKQEPSTPASSQTDARDNQISAGKDRDESSANGDMGAAHRGPVIELGITQIGGYTVRASRDHGEIKPGGDSPIDVWLTTESGGDTSKVTAVRFWIGTESGTESVKARADIENPAEPNHWHTHAEVPSPLPAGSKLWVEIEMNGQKHVGSFDLEV